jgi:hypothetical protein
MRVHENLLLDGKDDWTVFTPGCVQIDIAKSGNLEHERPIGGVCSTERLDRQEERVFAKGLLFNEFVEHGFFNDNHSQKTADILGAPKLAELRKGRWWTEGNLLFDYEPADRVWRLAKSLAKSAIARRLGFSIEGKIVERGFDNRILKAIIRHVAITNSPVNVDCTWDILAKSFAPERDIDAGTLRRSLSGERSNDRIERKPMSESMTLNEAVKIIKANRPDYSWATCEQAARWIFKQEQHELRRN